MSGNARERDLCAADRLLTTDSKSIASEAAKGKKVFKDACTQVNLDPVVLHSEKAPPPLKNHDILYVSETHTDRKLGVFAGFDLPKGYKIIAENPALSCIQWRKGKKTVSDEWLKMSHRQRENLQVWFRKLRKVPHGGNDTFKDSDKQKLERFISNYAFWDPQRERAHTYKLASLINHACRSCANAQYWVESAQPNEISIRLVKDVKSTDEIFICYNKRVPYSCPLCPRRKTPMSRLKTALMQFGACGADRATDEDGCGGGSRECTGEEQGSAGQFRTNSSSDQTLVSNSRRSSKSRHHQGLRNSASGSTVQE